MNFSPYQWNFKKLKKKIVADLNSFMEIFLKNFKIPLIKGSPFARNVWILNKRFKMIFILWHYYIAVTEIHFYLFICIKYRTTSLISFYESTTLLLSTKPNLFKTYFCVTKSLFFFWLRGPLVGIARDILLIRSDAGSGSESTLWG